MASPKRSSGAESLSSTLAERPISSVSSSPAGLASATASLNRPARLGEEGMARKTASAAQTVEA